VITGPDGLAIGGGGRCPERQDKSCSGRTGRVVLPTRRGRKKAGTKPDLLSGGCPLGKVWRGRPAPWACHREARTWSGAIRGERMETCSAAAGWSVAPGIGRRSILTHSYASRAAWGQATGALRAGQAGAGTFWAQALRQPPAETREWPLVNTCNAGSHAATVERGQPDACPRCFQRRRTRSTPTC